jgi:anti-anti-sigma factor
MTIKLIKKSESKAELLFDGRLDTATAPAAQEAFLKVAAQYAEMELNFTDLAYVSSAGLRALLMLQKQVNKTGGSLVLTNVKPSVKEVFEITGFAGIMNIAD